MIDFIEAQYILLLALCVDIIKTQTNVREGIMVSDMRMEPTYSEQ